MKTLLPEGFEITGQMREWAEAKIPQVDIDAETETFKDYWLAHGRKMSDWVACWRVWMRRAPKMRGAMKAPTQVHATSRWPLLNARAKRSGFRAPYAHDTPDTYETSLRRHERECA